MVYGLLKDPEKIEREAREFKVWYGGCGVSPDSPRKRIICTTCGYAMHPLHKFWERKGVKPADFASPLSPIVGDLPLPEAGKRTREVAYHQYVKDDGALWEYVVARSTEPFSVVWPRVKAHLDAISPGLAEVAFAGDGRTEKRLNARWKDLGVEAEVAVVPAYSDTYVRVTVRRGRIWDINALR